MKTTCYFCGQQASAQKYTRQGLCQRHIEAHERTIRIYQAQAETERAAHRARRAWERSPEGQAEISRRLREKCRRQELAAIYREAMDAPDWIEVELPDGALEAFIAEGRG